MKILVELVVDVANTDEVSTFEVRVFCVEVTDCDTRVVFTVVVKLVELVLKHTLTGSNEFCEVFK